MFLKPDGQLNFATTLGGQPPTCPSKVSGRRRGIALLDAPNMMCSLIPLHGTPLVSDDRFNLRRIGKYLNDRFDVNCFDFVIAKQLFGQRHKLKDAVRRMHWNYIEVAKCRYGWDMKDPVDDHIREMIRSHVHKSESRGTIAIVSHDGGYAPHLRYAIDEGWRVVIVGIVERMSHRLQKLAGSQVEILDLKTLGLELRV